MPPTEVAGRERKYVLDTNLFIRAFREPGANAELIRFHAAFAPFEYLSVVVAHELRAGVRRPADRSRLEREVFGVFTRRNRVLTPSARAWEQAGDVLAELARREGLEVAKVPRSFGNDVLLALSCREAGMILVTANLRDFDRIRRVVAFEYTAPWPAASPG
jgi:predicted nucleic acid-binding protein